MDFTKQLLKYRITSAVLIMSGIIVFGITVEINSNLIMALGIIVVIIMWSFAAYAWLKHQCPVCKESLDIRSSYTYCPHCGSDLTNVDEDML